MTYSEAIETVMRSNGGYATLKLIYKDIWKYKQPLKGRTPDKTVQERVQRDERFVRIGLGLYALREYQQKGKLPQVPLPKTAKEKQVRQHTEIQGMLILIGNQTDGVSDTYTPDKSGDFSGGKLGNVASLSAPHRFATYPQVMQSVKYMDVVWFNERKYPSHFFEIEHSTDFGNALTKFCDLQDFYANFICVSSDSRRDKFNRQLQRPAFKAMRDRCEFKTYNEVNNDYKIKLKRTFI